PGGPLLGPGRPRPPGGRGRQPAGPRPGHEGPQRPHRPALQPGRRWPEGPGGGRPLPRSGPRHADRGEARPPLRPEQRPAPRGPGPGDVSRRLVGSLFVGPDLRWVALARRLSGAAGRRATTDLYVTGEGLAPHHRLATAGLARPGRRAGVDAGAGVSRVGEERGWSRRGREGERARERDRRLGASGTTCVHLARLPVDEPGTGRRGGC